MKLIDEKGKIFGKVNIIDLALILIVLLLVSGVGYKLFLQKNNSALEQPKEEKEAEITFYIKQCIPESKDAIKKGDKLIIENELSEVEVIKVETEDSRVMGINEFGEAVVTTSPLAIDMYVTVRAKVDVSVAGITLNEEKIKVNTDFILETIDFYGGAKVSEISYEK